MCIRSLFIFGNMFSMRQLDAIRTCPKDFANFANTNLPTGDREDVQLTGNFFAN